MRTPFKELKDAEVEALRWRHAGAIPPKIISRLRKLFNRCRKDPEARAAICYHGSLALLHEFDHEWSSAAKQRSKEITMIEKLRSMMAKEPQSLRRWSTQNYRAIDLQERRRILTELVQKGGPNQGAAAPMRVVKHGVRRRAIADVIGVPSGRRR